VSTAQVIHPHKYIAGVLPAEIELPELPPLFDEFTQGTFGELRTRVALDQCHSPELAWRAAGGWRGDAFRVGRRADGAIALAWLTVMDTEDDASELHAALGTKHCWPKNRVG